MILTSLALLIVALIGGLALEIFGDRAMNNLSIILAFGGAFIMGLIFLHLVPEAFSYSSIAGTFVLIGFLLQILLEYLSKGLETVLLQRMYGFINNLLLGLIGTLSFY